MRLNRNIQNHSGNRAADLGCTAYVGVFGNTVTDNLQFTLGCVTFFYCLLIIRLTGFEFFLGNNTLLVELFVSFIYFFYLLEGNFRQINPRFGTV